MILSTPARKGWGNPVRSNKMNYAQQSTAPEWYGSDPSKIYESATSGSSPFNEWYEFDDRKQAIKFINRHFKSQSFVDGFVGVEEQNEYYYIEDATWDEEKEDFIPNDGAEPADLASMIRAESCF